MDASTFAGCSPGFWKAHPERWVGVSPSDPISSMFSATPARYAAMSLMHGLQLGGGSGVDGATRILLRQAIAAVLNKTGAPAISKKTTVNFRLTQSIRARMLGLAAHYDWKNNWGCLL